MSPRRLVTVLVVVVAAGAFAPAALAKAPAPGAPGAKHAWAPADKHGFGTARGERSNVWFTLRKAELSEVVLPLTSDAPTESELRLAQAQLVGWLEGLFHGIQATLFTQQAAAQGQLEQMRRRALEQAPPTATGPSGYL